MFRAMRVFGILASATILSACGGSSGRVAKPAFAVGAEVRISDGGQIYDALNTTSCVRWPSAEVKKKAGRDGWSGFNPQTGNEGKVLAALAHCDGKTQVLLVAVGDYVVPVTSKGVEAKDGKKLEDELAGIGVIGGGGGGVGYGGLAYGGYDVYGEGYGGYGVEGGVVGGVMGGSAYSVGATVEIIDAGAVYPTLNTLDCITWPSEDAKKKGGEDAWGKYTPAAGEIGTILGVSYHCDDYTEVLILDVGGKVVPIGSFAVSPVY
jgi:hypothetical protein